MSQVVGWTTASRALICALALSVTGLVLPAPSSATKLYRWVDEEGVVHMSDKPPAEATRRSGFTEEDVAPIPVTQTRRVPLERMREAWGQESSGSEDGAREDEADGDRDRCQERRARVAAIEDRLRRGYGPSEGEALDEERRDLQMAILKEC